MLFNSYIFLFLFLPIVFFTYFYLNSQKFTEASKVFLVFASLFFYGWWNISYLPIILTSIFFNYIVGSLLNRVKRINYLYKKPILIFGIVSNLALLIYFKYTNFLIDNLNDWVVSENIINIDLALPLAISFFTFQQISYLVDSYKNKTKEYSFLNYSLFVTFFPQLIAGPIVHHNEMMPQFFKIRNKVKNHNNISLALFIFAIGLFKKVIIADSFSVWATQGFDIKTTLNFFEAWSTSLSYTFQLYFDFSGYSDMAIGLALLFNIKLPINFNSPYKATNIQDFWRRWHITLGRFLKDYIYIPLGGNREKEYKTYSNLMITFIIGGIWHGAGWTFIFWGFLHGLALVIHRIWTKIAHKFNIKLNTWIAWIITFNFINFSWVFFRAKEWDDAIKILKGMIDINFNIPINTDHFFLILFSLTITIFFKNSMEIAQHHSKKSWAKWVTIYLLIISFLQILNIQIQNDKISEFLYFNF